MTIDRPERHNAVDQATEAELIRIWETIERARDIRVAVLTGAGARAFCTGADMKGGSGASGLEYWAKARPGGFGGIALRDTLDVPVIARVNGYALGGGMEMMLGCDIVVASADATFGLPEPRLGRLALDGGIALLARRIPHVQAMGMLLDMAADPGFDVRARKCRGHHQETLGCQPRDGEIGLDTAVAVEKLCIDDPAVGDPAVRGGDAV